MMLKSVLWNMFQDTGRIDAYLFYRGCDQDQKSNEESALSGSVESENKQ